MSRYRLLPDLGHALASRFALSMEHFAWIAMASGIGQVSLDLLHGSIEPPVFDTDRNRVLAGMLRELVVRAQESEFDHRLQAVRLVVHFDLTSGNPPVPLVDALVRVVVTDDRGRDWARELRVAGVQCSPPRPGDNWPPRTERG